MNEKAPHVRCILTQLRLNDPSDSLFSATDISEMIEALNSNDRIQTLRLDFDGVERRLISLAPIPSTIESRSMLKTVVVLHSPLRMSSAILRSVAKNPGIQSVVLHNRTVVSVESCNKQSR
jgi:hypothetical protein